MNGPFEIDEGSYARLDACNTCNFQGEPCCTPGDPTYDPCSAGRIDNHVVQVTHVGWAPNDDNIEIHVESIQTGEEATDVGLGQLLPLAPLEKLAIESE